MHIAETTHEHGVNAKVYAYEADYELNGDTLSWHADVRQGDTPPQQLEGVIEVSSPAAPLIAEQVVHDAIVRAIDAIDAIDSNH
ncbi:MAG TPA: hypothetical protein VLA16_00480 [Ideonella sp.]|nr:hypothetical protein [Ideonella sp.]